LGVASSSEHSWVDGHLQKLGLLEMFDVVVCQEDVQAIKPDPALFITAIKKLKSSKEQTLAFEDSANGLKAAMGAGLRVVVVPNRATVHGVFPGATMLLASLAEMPLKNLLQLIHLEIREEIPTDIPGIRQVERQAFGRSCEAELVDLCRERNKISLSLVASERGEIKGHVLFTPVHLEPADESLKGVGLGPIAVKPDRQRTGIGSQLIRHGLEICRMHGVDFIVLLGDPAYYSRFGFKPANEFGLTSDYEEGDVFQVMELRKDVFNGSMARVKYVPEFSEIGL
jgi:putative acetyltransferase